MNKPAAISDAGKADGITLLTGCRLIAAIFRRAGNDHPAHPIEDLLPLGKGQAVEVLGQMQRNPSPLSRADVTEIVTI